MARKILVEVEVPEGVGLDEVLRGVRYRVLGDKLWNRLTKIRKRYMEILGGPSSIEEYRSLEEALWGDEQ